MRLRARKDANQQEIVDVLRKWGVSVELIHMVGNGLPDILAGHRGINYLFEVKDGTRAPSERRLTGDEAAFHARWSGQVAVVESPQQALDVIFGKEVWK